MTSSIAPPRVTTIIIDLNDECQRKLCTYLSKGDLVALAMAVEQFRKISGEYFTCLIFHTDWYFLTATKIQNRIQTFGASIERLEIEFRQYSPPDKRKIIDCIAQHCVGKLIDLKFKNLDLTNEECASMRNAFKHLRKFEISCGGDHVDFSEFLSHSSPDIEELYLKHVRATKCRTLNLPKLKTLNLDRVNLTDDDVETIISRHPQIKSLRLYQNSLTDACFGSIAKHLPQIEELKFKYIKRSSSSQIEYLNRLHSLTSLGIFDEWRELSHPVWTIDFSQLPIEKLSIEFVDFMSAENAERFIANIFTLKRLKYLKLSAATYITVAHVLNIPIQFSELTGFHFNATEESALTVDNLLHIVRNGTKLETLNYDYLVDHSGGALRRDYDLMEEEGDSYTEHIDADAFKMFGDIMKSRPHKLHLEIFSDLYAPVELPEELEKFYEDSFAVEREL